MLMEAVKEKKITQDNKASKDNKEKEIKRLHNEDNKKKSAWKKPLIIVFVLLILITIIIIPASYASNRIEIKKIEYTHSKTLIKNDRQRKRIIKKQKTPIKYKKNDLEYRDEYDVRAWRNPNVKVDVGFDAVESTLPPGHEWNETSITRDYWGYTNKNSQLVFVQADKIILQDDTLEAPWFLGDGRYNPSVSPVPGSGDTYFIDGVSGKYQRGHVIADSLGGMSTAYNVVPEDAYINGGLTFPAIEGSQAEFEEDIRKAGGAEYFTARMKYLNKNDNAPRKYYVSYITGNYYNEWTFSNIDSRY